VPRRWILTASMPLGALAFWLCIAVAGLRFPEHYDWRYITVSQLIYPERNPLGHVWASLALAACALGGLIWVAALPRAWRFGGVYVLAIGYGCMIASSALPERALRMRYGHEGLAIAGFICVCTGLVQVSLRHLFSRGRYGRLLPAVLAAVAFSPIVVAGLTQAYLDYVRPDIPWVGLAWRSMGIPLYLSFALWEWVTCALLSSYMATIGIAVGKQAWKTSNW
jgi:hypothetical protein